MNRLVRALGAAVAVGGLLLGVSACGNDGSYDVRPNTYLDAAGVKDSAYKLLPLNGDANAPVYLAIGTQPSVTAPTQMVRIMITVVDQRTGTSNLAFDYPLAKFGWDIKSDVAPSVTFTRVHNGAILYRMGDPKESLWARNDYNDDKNKAIDKYDRAQQELFNNYTIKATVTLTQAIYDAQVKPLVLQSPAPVATPAPSAAPSPATTG